jgi:hypothetical protein
MAKKLDMGETTIGYSKEGIKALKTVITTGINDGAKKVAPSTSSSYKTLISTLRTYWDGNDEANFEKDLEACATILSNKLKAYADTIGKVLDNYASQFSKFQDTTYGKGSITIK